MFGAASNKRFRNYTYRTLSVVIFIAGRNWTTGILCCTQSVFGVFICKLFAIHTHCIEKKPFDKSMSVISSGGRLMHPITLTVSTSAEKISFWFLSHNFIPGRKFTIRPIVHIFITISQMCTILHFKSLNYIGNGEAPKNSHNHGNWRFNAIVCVCVL